MHTAITVCYSLSIVCLSTLINIPLCANCPVYILNVCTYHVFVLAGVPGANAVTESDQLRHIGQSVLIHVH